MGLGVALVVMWAGFSIAKDTLEPLIGEAVDPEIYEKIKKYVEKYEGIVGTHDLIVHNYGPNRSMASIHAEVPNDVNIETSHEIIDRIEREAVEELGIFLVIHMDPIETKDHQVLMIRGQVEELLKKLDPDSSIHDLRVVNGEEQINIIFDMVVPFRYSDEVKERLQYELIDGLQKIDPRYQCVITVEHSYVSAQEAEIPGEGGCTQRIKQISKPCIVHKGRENEENRCIHLTEESGYSEIDHRDQLTLPALINYFQDCSTFHSEDVGMGHKRTDGEESGVDPVLLAGGDHTIPKTL